LEEGFRQRREFMNGKFPKSRPWVRVQPEHYLFTGSIDLDLKGLNFLLERGVSKIGGSAVFAKLFNVLSLRQDLNHKLELYDDASERAFTILLNKNITKIDSQADYDAANNALDEDLKLSLDSCLEAIDKRFHSITTKEYKDADRDLKALMEKIFGRRHVVEIPD
jgi:hypothetical protein